MCGISSNQNSVHTADIGGTIRLRTKKVASTLILNCDSPLKLRRVPQTIGHDVVRQLEGKEVPDEVDVVARCGFHIEHREAHVDRPVRPNIVLIEKKIVTVGHVRHLPTTIWGDSEANEVVELEAVLRDVLSHHSNLNMCISAAFTGGQLGAIYIPRSCCLS
jgi:hypothetical protein